MLGPAELMWPPAQVSQGRGAGATGWSWRAAGLRVATGTLHLGTVACARRVAYPRAHRGSGGSFFTLDPGSLSSHTFLHHL